MEYLDDLFETLPNSSDLSYRAFRKIWHDKGLRLVHIIPFIDEEKPARGADTEAQMRPRKMLSDIFRGLTEMLYANEQLEMQVYIIYTMYTLYETQVTPTKHHIIVPEIVWPILTLLKKEFAALEIRDPLAVLQKMYRDGMFTFALDFPYVQNPDGESDIYDGTTVPIDLSISRRLKLYQTEPLEIDAKQLSQYQLQYTASMAALGSSAPNTGMDKRKLCEQWLDQHGKLAQASADKSRLSLNSQNYQTPIRPPAKRMSPLPSLIGRATIGQIVPPLPTLIGGAGSGIATPLPPTNDPKRRPRQSKYQFSQINRQYIAATLRQPIPQFDMPMTHDPSMLTRLPDRSAMPMARGSPSPPPLQHPGGSALDTIRRRNQLQMVAVSPGLHATVDPTYAPPPLSIDPSQAKKKRGRTETDDDDTESDDDGRGKKPGKKGAKGKGRGGAAAAGGKKATTKNKASNRGGKAKAKAKGSRKKQHSDEEDDDDMATDDDDDDDDHHEETPASKAAAAVARAAESAAAAAAVGGRRPPSSVYAAAAAAAAAAAVAAQAQAASGGAPVIYGSLTGGPPVLPAAGVGGAGGTVTSGLPIWQPSQSGITHAPAQSFTLPSPPSVLPAAASSSSLPTSAGASPAVTAAALQAAKAQLAQPPPDMD